MSLDGDLKMWLLKDESFSKVGILIFGKNLQESFGLTPIGDGHLLLVVGGYDSNIHCYTCLRNPPVDQDHHKFFDYKFSLTGHMDSIKDFAFTKRNFEIANDIQLLASCSQDKYIRLWKI